MTRETKLATTAPTTSLEDAPPPIITELPGRFAAAMINDYWLFGTEAGDCGCELLVVGPVGTTTRGWMTMSVWCKNDAERTVWRSALGDHGRGCMTLRLRQIEQYMPAPYITDGHSMYDLCAAQTGCPEMPWTQWKPDGEP